MAVSWQIPRNCLGWILLSQLALIIPHAERLPWWVLAAYAVCALWRVMVYQGRWSFPPSSVKLLLTLLCFFGIYRSYGTMIGMEPTVALLFSGFCLKLLEVNHKRDVYVIIFLAYFVALTAFLFDQDFSTTVLMFVTLLLISTALIALHQHSYTELTLGSFKKASVIFLQAMPLMLVLFIVLPRFEPLWKVPMPSHQKKTGVTDTMSPGDVSSLSQSDELAFRVVFESELPPRQKLYWRGLVLSEFDGRSWRQSKWKQKWMTEKQADKVRLQQSNPIRYRVIQEATYQPWLFSLALAYSSDKDIRMGQGYRLLKEKPIHARIQYQVLSDQSAVIEPVLNDRSRSIETRLPPKGNPEARQFAQDLLARSTDNEDFIQRVLTLFREENFYYTLSPPLLGENTVDEFLFKTRRGFCGHYASSFVFLMRAAGLPARVVTGYQGGEINPITGTVLVHQFDAHGWAEVWLQDRGWVRVDPTAAVSPGRIEYGLENAMQEEGSFLSDEPLSPLRYRNVAWLNALRLRMDAFSYYWSDWVLQYKGERQLKVMTRLMGEVTPLRLAMFILSVAGIVLAFVAVDLLWRRSGPKPPPEVKVYLRLCERLESAGYQRLSNEGPIDFARRVASEQPAWKQHLLSATRAFVTLSYEPLSEPQRKAVLKQLRAAAFKLSYQLRLSA